MDVTKDEISLSPVAKVLTTFSLCLCAFMFVLDYTIANVAIPYIAGGLASSVDEGTYVLTFFSIGNAVAITTSGWLFQRIGMIRTFIFSVILFVIFSFLCGFAPSLYSLVVFRFLQGSAAGPIIPGVQGILTKIYHKKGITKAMVMFAIVTLLGPALGPVIGGIFCVEYSWRWIFYINIPVGVFCIFILSIFLWGTAEPRIKKSYDFFGFILVLVGVSSLQLILDKGQQWDWFASTKVCFLSGLSYLCLSYFVCWCFYSEKPLMNLRLLKNHIFTISIILIFIDYGLYMGSVVLVPLWLQTVMDYNAYWAGIAIAPLGFGGLISSIFVGRISKYVQANTLILISFILMALASWYTRYLYVEAGLSQIMLSRFFFGIAVGIFVTPLLSMPSMCLSSEELADGLSIFHTIRVLSGAIGVSFVTILLKRRSDHQHHNIISTFNYFKQESRTYYDQIKSLQIPESSDLPLLDKLVNQQAVTIAMDEVSLIMTILFMIGAIVCLFVYQRKNVEKNIGPT